jgi:hypothetical protein
VAVADSGSISLLKLTIVKMNVLANDSDSDGDVLSIVSVTQPPLGGRVTLHDHGTRLEYDPKLAIPVTFTYTISDGHGHTATATVTISVV